jgi:hypothetical protein
MEVSAVRVRASKRTLLLGVASLLGALALGEGLARWLLPRPGFQSRSPDNLNGLLIPDTATGWRYAPAFRGVAIRGTDTIPIETDHLGLRERPLTPGDSSAIRVLALGDSYTAGWGVRVEQAWPAQLQAALIGLGASPVRVFDAGVSGYNLHQIRRLGAQLMPALVPRLVILGAYAGGADRLVHPYVLHQGDLIRRGDIERAAAVPGGYIRPVASRPGWARTTELWLDQHSYFLGHLMRAGLVVKQKVGERLRGRREPVLPNSFLSELDSIQALVESQGAQLVVLSIASQERDGSFSAREKRLNDAVRTHADRRGIAILDPTPLLEASRGQGARFRLGADDHWSPAAHAIAAAFLADTLCGRGWVPNCTQAAKRPLVRRPLR